jgi:hypothetical protein
MRDINFNEGLSTYIPNSMLVPSSMNVSYPFPYFAPNFSTRTPILIYYSTWDNREYENPSLPTHPLVDSIEHETTPIPQLARWVYTTQEVVGDLVTDPSNQHHIHSKF